MSGHNRGPKPQRVLDLAQIAAACKASRQYIHRDPRTIHLGTAYKDAVDELASLQDPEFRQDMPAILVKGFPKRIRFDVSWKVLDGLALIYGVGGNRVYMRLETAELLWLERGT